MSEQHNDDPNSKDASFSCKLKADDGYSCELTGARISANQWGDIVAIAQGRKSLKAVEQQRDELLAALKRIELEARNIGSAHIIARAAIASAKGGSEKFNYGHIPIEPEAAA